MPSPLGHALASALLHKSKLRGPWLSDWKRLSFHIFCGISPDLDFIPGLFYGNINLFHHRFSHSFLGAGVIGLFLWVIYGLWRHVWEKGDLLLILGLVILHPIMDILAVDTAFPYGCPLFYPFLKKSWISPYVFFEDIQRPSLTGFFLGSNNLLAFWIEFIFFSPLLWAATVQGAKKKIGWAIAFLIALSVILFYISHVQISASGIEFVKVFKI